MKKAVQFGAGNIGRGFIGAVLAKAGYEVVFADVVDLLLDAINKRQGYVVHVMDTDKYDIEIKGIRAVNSNNPESSDELVDADIVTTAVGLRILRFIAPAIANGIKKRKAQGVEEPLHIIACENGLRATSQLKDQVLALLSDEEKEWTKTHVSFPDSAVDRIVPPVHCKDLLDVAVEEFYEWDVEKSAFLGTVPVIEGMNLVDNLEAYIERKLFTLNTGHATAAYLGAIRGYQTIGESIDDPEIYAVVKGAMTQSGDALIKKFGFHEDAHYAYIERILKRFQNPYLKDLCNRVGREPIRKLAPNDRLILPMLTAKGFGLPYDQLLLSIGAALHFNNAEDGQSSQLQMNIRTAGLRSSILMYTGLDSGDPVVGEIEQAYKDVMRFRKDA